MTKPHPLYVHVDRNVIAELNASGDTVREYIWLPEAEIAPTRQGRTQVDRPDSRHHRRQYGVTRNALCPRRPPQSPGQHEQCEQRHHLLERQLTREF